MSVEVFNKYIKKAKSYFKEHNYDKGINELDYALDVYENDHSLFEFPNVFKGLHISYLSITDQVHYANTILRVIYLLKEKKQLKLMAVYITHLSAALSQLGNFRKSIELLHQGLEILEGVEADKVKSQLKNGIGNYHFAMGEYEKAKEYYLDIFNLAKNAENVDWYKYGHNLGNAYKELKNYKKALEYLHLGEKYFLGQEDQSTWSNSFVDLAIVYYLLGNYKESEDYLKKAHDIAINLKLSSQLIDIAKERKNLYSRWNKFNLAFKYQSEYYERLRSHDINKAKYEVELAINDRDIKELKKDIEESDQENEQLNTLLKELLESKKLLQLAVDESNRVQSLLIEKNSELSNAYDKIISVQDKLLRTEKNNALNRLIVKISHELNTPLGNITLIMDYFYNKLEQAFKIDDKEKRLNEINNTVTSILNNKELLQSSINASTEFINTLQTSILDYNNESTSDVHIKSFFDNIILEQELKYQSINCSYVLNINEDINWNLPKRVLRTVFRHLIENSYEHGFVENTLNKISITVEVNGHLCIYYSDNGKGLDNSIQERIFEPFLSKQLNDKGKLGHGLFVVKSLIEDLLDGRIVLVDSTKGIMYKIIFKK